MRSSSEIRRSLYSVSRSLYSVSRSLYSVLYSVSRSLYSVSRSLYSVSRSLYSVSRSLYGLFIVLVGLFIVLVGLFMQLALSLSFSITFPRNVCMPLPLQVYVHACIYLPSRLPQPECRGPLFELWNSPSRPGKVSETCPRTAQFVEICLFKSTWDGVRRGGTKSKTILQVLEYRPRCSGLSFLALIWNDSPVPGARP